MRKKQDNTKLDKRPPPPFPIVAVGASAGGLEAFTQLLKSLPTDTGLGFVLVQHLGPVHESELTRLLARATSMPTRDAANNVRVALPPVKEVSLFCSRRRPSSWPARWAASWGLGSPRHWAPGGVPTHAGELRPTQRELTACALRIAGRMAIGEAAVHPAQMAVQESLCLGSDGP